MKLVLVSQNEIIAETKVNGVTDDRIYSFLEDKLIDFANEHGITEYSIGKASEFHLPWAKEMWLV